MEKKKSCKSFGVEHPHGSKVCKNNKCVRCSDGQWEEMSE